MVILEFPLVSMAHMYPQLGQELEFRAPMLPIIHHFVTMCNQIDGCWHFP